MWQRRRIAIAKSADEGAKLPRRRPERARRPGVTTWGLSDPGLLLEVTKKTDYARLPGPGPTAAGRRFNSRLPLDSSMRAKPMYFAIRDAPFVRQTEASETPEKGRAAVGPRS